MSEKTLTHKDLAEMLGVSETTVKSYRRKFPGCIPVFSQGKPIRFPAQASEVALRIRDLFELGMSVEEVRLRLAEEFSWISPKAEQEGKAGGQDKAEIVPELAHGVSNMAKSMVAMTQQQKAIQTRMQAIESMLEELGVQGSVDVEGRRKAAAEQNRQKEARITERLDSLDAVTQELAGNVAALADTLGLFLERREQAAGEWQRGGGLQGTVRELEQDAQTREAGTGSKVIPLRQESAPPPKAPNEPAMTESRPTEPPRQFFGHPLVLRNGQGQYESASGRGRGRFSLNDLKAMLAHMYMPPHHFTFGWEAYGQGWWLYLDQANPQDGEEARSYAMLLMELPTQKGNAVVEILQLKSGGTTLHPAEICTIIGSLGE